MWNEQAQQILAQIEALPAGSRYLEQLGAAYQDYLMCLEGENNQEIEDAAINFLLAHYLHQAANSYTQRHKRLEKKKLGF